MAAGDVEWSRTWFDKTPGSLFLDPGETVRAKGGWQPLPRFVSPATLAILREKYPQSARRYEQSAEQDRLAKETQSGVAAALIEATHAAMKPHDLAFESDIEWAKYPFRKVRDAFQAADIVFVNLESP